jgi:hypothetical protein
MTYEEFIKLQIGDVVEIHSKDDAYGDSCVVIIIHKERIKSEGKFNRIKHYHFCKMIYPSRLEKLAACCNDTSIILHLTEYTSEIIKYGCTQYGFVDDEWSIGCLKNVFVDDLKKVQG